MATTAPLIVRLFDLGEGTAARDRELAEGSPALIVIGTADEEEQSWLAAGCALGRVLLLAADQGLDASYLNQPVEVAELRRPIAELAGSRGFPQLVLQLGRGEPGGYAAAEGRKRTRVARPRSRTRADSQDKRGAAAGPS